MRETRPSGSVEGVTSNRDPYSDYYYSLNIQHFEHTAKPLNPAGSTAATKRSLRATSAGTGTMHGSLH
jgi:hypothetical protein